MAIYKYSFRVGRLNQWNTKNKIEVYCFHKNIECQFIKSNGFLEITFLCEFTGKAEDISDLQIFLNGLFNPYKPLISTENAEKILGRYGICLKEPLHKAFFFRGLGIRPESELKDTLENIKEAIKLSLINREDVEQRQALVYLYTLLGTFVVNKVYNRLKFLTKNKSKLNEKEKLELNELMNDIEDDVYTATEILRREIHEFLINQEFK